MKIILAVRNQGHVPSFKNNKMLVRGRLITDPKKQKWMQRCIQSFESQLFLLTRTTAAGTLTDNSLRSLIASSLPLDDSHQWIPEIKIEAVQLEMGHEGAVIIIEPIV